MTMRKHALWTVIAILAALLVTGGPARAADATGTILLDGYGPGSSTRALSEQLAACALQTNGAAGQGLFGYVVDVTPGAGWGLGAADSPTSNLPAATVTRRGRFAIAFYSMLPTCTDPGEVVARSTGHLGGTVPEDATAGIIVLTSDVNAQPPTCSIIQIRLPYPGVPYPLPTIDPTCVQRYRWSISVSGPGAAFFYTESAPPVVEPTPTPTPTATATPQPSVHVDDVTASYSHVGKKAHKVVVSATITDESSAPVAGAEVAFSVTSPEGTVYTGTGTTDDAGTASHSVQQNSGGHGTWETCVTSVTAVGYTYDSSLNAETCTSLTVE